MDHLSALDLCPPPQRKPDRESFDYRPKAVEQWLKDLPIANLGETSRALYEALREVNGLQIKSSARIEFLERVGAQVNYAVQGLSKHYPPREFPLPAKSRKIAELSLTLLREMAGGYHIVIQSALTGTRTDDKTLALAIYRSLRYSGSLLTEVFGIYEPSPAGLWKVAHGLYLAAEARGIASLPVPDPERAGTKRATVIDAYKQLLLLAAAGPYKMRHNEAADAYALLERLTPYTQLAAPNAPAAADVTFLVEMNSDAPPRPLVKGAEPRGDARALVTAGLQTVLEENEAGAKRSWWRPWRKAQVQSDPELLRRIVISLGALPKRQFSRLPVGSRNQVHVMIGLNHIGKTLAEHHGMKVNAADDPAARFVSREVGSAEAKTDDVWDLVFPAELLSKSNKPKAAQTPEAPVREAADAQHWRLVNMSAGGYCLLSDPGQSARAHVGELIALRELTDSASKSWQLCVIRWMKHVPGEGLQLGVQVLGPTPLPVLVNTGDHDGVNERQALLLPEIIAVEQPPTLILPCLQSWAPGRKVKLSALGSDSEIVLGGQLEATSSFVQFAFRAGGADASSQEPEFDSVFSSI
jgi:hypothetical protein